MTIVPKLRALPFQLLLLAFLFLFVAPVAVADDEEPSLSQVGELVDFARDVKPIFDAKCVMCHGPDEAKNDFRVDVADSIADYVEAGDVDASSLWSDYLVTDDADMRMPPVGHAEVAPLTGAELGTIKLWIEEGAKWSEATEDAPAEAAFDASKLSDAAKWWRLQGMFHPASVHFPIALIVVSAGFVVLSFLNRDSFEPVAFHCLWIGALGAIASCVMGWSYAEYEGYGGGYSFDLQGKAIDRHRWLGVAAAVLAVILIPIARSVRKSGDTGMRLMWMLGSFLAVGAVSVAGYQGGELTYGEDHYMNEYQRLFPSVVTEEPLTSDETAVTEVQDDDQEAVEPETQSPSPEQDSAAEERAADEPVVDEPATEATTTQEPASDAPAESETAPPSGGSEKPNTESGDESANASSANQ